MNALQNSHHLRSPFFWIFYVYALFLSLAIFVLLHVPFLEALPSYRSILEFSFACRRSLPASMLPLVLWRVLWLLFPWLIGIFKLSCISSLSTPFSSSSSALLPPSPSVSVSLFLSLSLHHISRIPTLSLSLTSHVNECIICAQHSLPMGTIIPLTSRALLLSYHCI